MKNSSYHMPAEWAPHRATWLAWPHQTSDWPGKFAPIPWVYGEIVRILAEYEAVELLVTSAKVRTVAERVLASVPHNAKNVRLHSITTNRSWLRDSGPTFVYDSKKTKTALTWQFNGWAKYDDWPVDNRVPGAIAKKAKLFSVVPMWNGRKVVLEGGGIEVNGQGLVLTTEEWLLSDVQVRNPGFTREDYEQIFTQYLGASKTLWLGHGIVGDDTHGHIDDLARFVDERTVVVVQEPNEADDNHRLLKDNWERLSGMSDQKGRKLEVVALPMPKPVVFRGQRLPASYANFYIGNGVVIVPTFNDVNDHRAVGIISELFPKHDVISLFCGDLILGLGTLHCLSQQEID